MKSAVRNHNIRLIDVPGVDDNIFIIATASKMGWYEVTDDELPEVLMDEVALEQAGYAIMALLAEVESHKATIIELQERIDNIEGTVRVSV